MRVLNNRVLIIREKSQQKYGLIILPDSKIVSGKNCLVLVAGKVKLEDAIVDNEVQNTDRVMVLQYDGLPIKAWKDLYIPLDREVDTEKLPNGVYLSKDYDLIRLVIKKGTPLQLIDANDIQSVLLDGFSVDDQKI